MLPRVNGVAYVPLDLQPASVSILTRHAPLCYATSEQDAAFHAHMAMDT